MSLLFGIKAADCKQHKKCLSKADKEKLAAEFEKMRL
tara:strand:- start:827 stop:937 length:111 start_codon:yes stop_codon:yes gene_type:complete